MVALGPRVQPLAGVAPGVAGGSGAAKLVIGVGLHRLALAGGPLAERHGRAAPVGVGVIDLAVRRPVDQPLTRQEGGYG